MRHSRFSLTMLPLTPCFALGCGNQPSSDDTRDTKAVAGRLEAAKAIQSNHERDTSLADLAKDAAKAGDGTVIQGAIASIVSNHLHDTATAEASLLLAKTGKSTDATAVAKLIRDQTTLVIKPRQRSQKAVNQTYCPSVTSMPNTA